MVGATLTANPNTAHVDYQWLRSKTTDVNGEYEEISGATSKTYILDDADKDKHIKVKVTGISGKATGDMTSDPTAQVELLNAVIGAPSGIFYHNDEEDITADITWKSAREIAEIYDLTSAQDLTKEMNYTVDGNTLTIKKDYLKTVVISPEGSGGATLKVKFDRGADAQLDITIKTKYTVTFVDYDDTVLKTGKVIKGEDATAPANPTRTGYTFMGWDKAFTNVTGDLTVKAEYAKNEYTVTFNKNGGEAEANPTTMDVAKGGKLSSLPTEPTREGYRFDSWNTAANGSGDTFDTNTVVNGDITVYAKWVELQKFTVSFNANGGTGTMGPETVTEGEEYTLPANGFTAPEHKEFVRWVVGSSDENYKPGTKVVITANTTIKPIWQNKSIEIWNAPAKVLPGKTYNMYIYIHGDYQNGTGITEKVDLTLTGSSDSKTGITKTGALAGLLTIGIDETAEQLTLRAAKKDDATVYDEVTINVHHGNALIINKEDKTVDKLDSEGYSWNKDTQTLEIKNLSVNEIGYGIVFAGFTTNENITLKLQGTNQINIRAGDDPSNPEVINVVGITYSRDFDYSGANLIIEGDGNLEITMPELDIAASSNYGINMDNLTVTDSASLKIVGVKADTARGINTLINTTFKEKAKVEIESYGDVIASFGSGGNIFIKDQAEFKGTAYGKGTILHTLYNIKIEEGTKVELIRPNFPNASNGPKFFDYITSLTLADGLKLQGSENADGSSLVEAKLYGEVPKWVARNSDLQNVFKYVLIEAGETTKYDVTVVDVMGGTATVNVDKTEAAAGETVTVTIANIESGKQFKSITVTDADSGTVATTEVTSGASYTFVMPAKNATVEVEVEAVSVTQYDVTVATVVGGTADVTVDKAKAAAGETVTVTIENIGDGKELFNITVTGF